MPEAHDERFEAARERLEKIRRKIGGKPKRTLSDAYSTKGHWQSADSAARTHEPRGTGHIQYEQSA
jgi:hypothetical protein